MKQYRPPVGEGRFEKERAYTQGRWVGLLSKGIDQCPKVEGWEDDSLLDLVLDKAARKSVRNPYAAGPECDDERSEVRLKLADHRLLHEMGLDRYCVYTRLNDQAPEFKAPSGVKARPDRLALSVISAGGAPADLLSQRIWPDLAQQFHRQTGQKSEPLAPLRLTGEPSVRLTFIDSEPDGEGVPAKPSEGESLHGYTLAHFANELICPSPGSCAATIATRRALGHQKFNSKGLLPPQESPDGQRGHMGLVSDLATAILAEVLHWRQFDPDKKLILNLSLGWDGEGFGDLDKRSLSKLEPSVQAVYKALRFARRKGALVIAAAGNQRGSEQTRWPLLPAAWELRRPAFFPLTLWRKPVYAVGGVDERKLSLPNSRRGGRPRRVAYGDHAVVDAGQADGPTAIYTGTSVSAAVTSSIAAVIWHLRPELKPAQVMKLVTRSGDRLPSRADFYAWKGIWPLSELLPAPRTRLLSLCSAVVETCGPDQAQCPALASFPRCLPQTGEERDLAEALEGIQGTWHQAKNSLAGNPGGESFVDAASQRWVLPQPSVTPCPGCTLVLEPPDSTHDGNSTPPPPWFYRLKLEISQEWQKQADAELVKITDAKLIITRKEDNTVVWTSDLNIPADQLTAAGGVHIVRLPDLVEGYMSNRAAQITFGLTHDPSPVMPPVLNPVKVDS